MDNIVSILTACAPILVALVGIVPTIIANRKKTQESIDKLQKTLDAHIKEDEDEKAHNERYRILRFYDEMCENRRHSESHFEDVLDSIDSYEKYCNRHPDFQNSRGHVAMQQIKDVYGRLKINGGFLGHEEGE